MSEEDNNKQEKITKLQYDQKYMSKEFQDLKEQLNDGFKELSKKIDEQKRESERNYAPKNEFKIVKNIVFGMVGIFLVSFFASVIEFFIST